MEETKKYVNNWNYFNFFIFAQLHNSEINYSRFKEDTAFGCKRQVTKRSHSIGDFLVE